MFVCTSRTRHGDYDATVTSQPQTTMQGAFHQAALLTDIGYRASTPNIESGFILLDRWEKGERPAPGKYLTEGHTHMSDTGVPTIQIGWVDYSFTSTPRLWRVVAQVETQVGEWSGSRQVPTFFIDPAAQGALTKEAAHHVADDILSTMGGQEEHVTFHIDIEGVWA